MDEKTEELRDIFMEVADDATVTEPQEEDRWASPDPEEVAGRLRSTVESMRERYEFSTSLSTGDLVTVVRGFYAGKGDAEIARELEASVDSKTVARARVDLHLVADRDLDAPVDLDDLRDLLSAGRSTGEIADELGVSPSTVRRYRRIVETQRERRVVGDRFRAEFERVLEDRDLADRLTEAAREKGLEEATEGLESNVSF